MGTLEDLEARIAHLEKIIAPIERKNYSDSLVKNNIVLSCYGVCSKHKQSIGIIIRGVGLYQSLEISKLTSSEIYEEVCLDSIYQGIQSLVGLNLFKIKVPIIIHTNSRDVSSYINGNIKTKSEKLSKKIQLIKNEIRALELLREEKIEVEFKLDRETHDMYIASNLAYEVIEKQ